MADEKPEIDLNALEAELEKALAPERTEIEEQDRALKLQADLNREIAKFTANAFDRASTSLVALGIFSPAVSVLYRTSTVIFDNTQELWMAVVGCAVGVVVLHRVGRGFLEKEFLR